jgi:hypothetical protein
LFPGDFHGGSKACGAGKRPEKAREKLSDTCEAALNPSGRISGLLNFLLAYFSFLWKKELHVAAGDLSGTKDIA